MERYCLAHQLRFDFGKSASSDRPPGLPDLAAVEAVVVDPEATVKAKSRSIAAALAGVYGLMTREQGQRERRRMQPLRMNAVKTLRELARSVFDGDIGSHADTLDMSGLRFRFVLGRVTDLFEQALRDGGLAAKVADQVISNFEAAFASREEDIRTMARGSTAGHFGTP